VVPARLAFQDSPPRWVFTVKERLTGAIILVALIVLLVPELLSGPVRSAPRAAAVASPSAEGPPLRSYTINLADDAHMRGSAAQTSGPQQPALVAAAAPPVAESAVSAPPASQSAPRNMPPASPRAAPEAPPEPAAGPGTATPGEPPSSTAGSGAFVVQLGSFASRANADHLARQVRAQGFQVSVSQGSSGRHLYRVRVGPAHDRAAATALAQQLRTAGHSGTVVPK
jgi:cell division septation protein DedD